MRPTEMGVKGGGVGRQVVMVGPGGELARMGVAAQLAPPTWPACLHDWDLSLAAAAACKALAATSLDALSEDPSAAPSNPNPYGMPHRHAW